MRPIQFGGLTLPHRAVFGPMAGFTDAACRRLMAQHGAGFTVSEMVSSRALTFGLGSSLVGGWHCGLRLVW